jgi:hypothetical protein
MSVARANVNIVAAGVSPGTNVWHFRTGNDITGAAGKAEAQDCLDKIRVFYAALAAGAASGSTFKCDGATDVESDEGVSLNWTTVTGAQAGQLLPPACSVCISWKTSIRARRGMGRTFLGPYTYAWLDGDGTLLTGALNILNTAATNLVNSSLLDNGWAVGVWGQEEALGKVTAAERRLAPHVLRDITGYTLKDKFATLRSRRP